MRNEECWHLRESGAGQTFTCGDATFHTTTAQMNRFFAVCCRNRTNCWSENEKIININETFAHGDSFRRRATVFMNVPSGASFITQLQEEATHP